MNFMETQGGDTDKDGVGAELGAGWGRGLRLSCQSPNASGPALTPPKWLVSYSLRKQFYNCLRISRPLLSAIRVPGTILGPEGHSGDHDRQDPAVIGSQADRENTIE